MQKMSDMGIQAVKSHATGICNVREMFAYINNFRRKARPLTVISNIVLFTCLGILVISGY